MKIVYCLIDSSRPGGMERSICSKVNYLADVMGYEVTIVNTDRNNKDNFYAFSPRIKFFDLCINYNELDSLPFFKKLIVQVNKRKLHLKRLSDTLFSIKPDISISTYTHELSLLCKIKDGSKKIVETHFCKQYKEIEYGRKSKLSLKRMFAMAAERRKQKYIKRYDAFVVLTDRDRKEWKGLSRNIDTIPNVVPFYPDNIIRSENKRIISVGRLTYDKGYPLLLEAWRRVAATYREWRLDIYGQGEDNFLLNGLIDCYGLKDVVTIHSPEQNIEQEYLNSSIFVMSSLHEGFGLALTEAMACGAPCVSFDCPSGPSEIITNGEDGLIVEYKSVEKLAQALLFLIEDNMLRSEMGINARENVKRFLPERVMPRWVSLFERITGLSNY